MEEEQPQKRNSRKLVAGLAAGVLALGAVGAGVAGASSGDGGDQARSGSNGLNVVQETEPREQKRDALCPEREGRGGEGKAGSGANPDRELAPVSLRY